MEIKRISFGSNIGDVFKYNFLVWDGITETVQDINVEGIQYCNNYMELSNGPMKNVLFLVKTFLSSRCFFPLFHVFIK